MAPPLCSGPHAAQSRGFRQRNSTNRKRQVLRATKNPPEVSNFVVLRSYFDRRAIGNLDCIVDATFVPQFSDNGRSGVMIRRIPGIAETFGHFHLDRRGLLAVDIHPNDRILNPPISTKPHVVQLPLTLLFEQRHLVAAFQNLRLFADGIKGSIGVDASLLATGWDALGGLSVGDSK